MLTRIIFALVAMLLAKSVVANQITIYGLSDGKAVVSHAGGKLKVLRPGDTLAEGIKLHSADKASAVFLIHGRKQHFTLGQNISVSSAPSQAPRLSITADSSGHFFAQGTINGGAIRFLVDTGATKVFLGASDARRLGINYLKGTIGYSSTAGGTIRVYHVSLDTVQIGDLSAAGVQAVVSEKDDTPFALLGMSFLNRMRMDRDGDQLTLTKRF